MGDDGVMTIQEALELSRQEQQGGAADGETAATATEIRTIAADAAKLGVKVDVAAALRAGLTADRLRGEVLKVAAEVAPRRPSIDETVAAALDPASRLEAAAKSRSGLVRTAARQAMSTTTGSKVKPTGLVAMARAQAERQSA